MTQRRKIVVFAALAAVAMAVLLLLSPLLVRQYWSVRSSNPVRRGIQKAEALGCFSCHGSSGAAGIPDPSDANLDVPDWNGGVWMMYVKSDEEIEQIILNGSSVESHAAAIPMPAYRELISADDLGDLVAAFKILAEMNVPKSGSPERRGYTVAKEQKCFSCHGPAGSGGPKNPESFSGTIPGWYGPAFDDLVRGREEFDLWIREGSIPRLDGHPIASRFIARQRIAMPRYPNLSAEQIDDLWSYTQWPRESGGGYTGVNPPW
jgi:mono/diheme cytochrome c family protein